MSSSDQAAKQQRNTPTSFQDLPPELLGHLISYIQEVQTLLRLGLACKKLHDFVQSDGYRVFVQRHYPWIPIPPSWEDAVHALTKLSLAWDRKSLIPRYIEPPHNAAITAAHNTGSRGRRGQTMGYQPVIDSYDTWIGSDWTSRRETVAWGAGAELVLRVRWMGPDVEQEWRRAAHRQPIGTYFDQHHHKSRWWRVLEPNQADGKDDITIVMLLRETQKLSPGAEYIIVGRASGDLDLLSIAHVAAPGSWKRETRFQTNGQSIRAASVNAAIPPLLAACLEDRTIAIYHVLPGIHSTEPLGKIQFDSLESPCRLWSTVFLRQDRLAVSLGPHVEPIQIFEVKPNAIPQEPVRRMAMVGLHNGQHVPNTTTVYPLVPLPRSSCPCEAEGDLFLSGGYDGTVRLHDLRSPASYVASFNDPVDSTAAIYSLIPLGRDRFLAGSAQFATIKLFNMRTAVEKLCHNKDSSVSPPETAGVKISSPGQVQTSAYPAQLEQRSEQKPELLDWTVFLANRNGLHGGQQRRIPREWTSPVYSLSSPSLYSPVFFAGIEGHVIQVDVTSAYDRFPDPIYKCGLASTSDLPKDAARKWDPYHDVMCVDLYEHSQANIEIMHQTRIGERKQGDQIWVMLDSSRIFVRLSGERIFFTSPSRTSLSIQTPNSYPGKEPLNISSSGGTAYITNQRIVYLPTSPTPQLQSFSAPILNLQDTHVDAPFFGANSWTGILKPVTGGGIPPNHAYIKISMTFKDGGAFDFATTYERTKETITQAVEVARESGRQQGTAEFSDINLEQLPAYEDVGNTIALSAAPPPPLQQPTPMTATVAPSYTPQRDSGVATSAAEDEERNSKQSAATAPQEQTPHPDEPPPGYEEAQRQHSNSVVDNLERNLRISK
ncbi:MAG: hypothetical protein Q9186_000508 [Xanthomendoza sp. 1 TL-2023]